MSQSKAIRYYRLKDVNDITKLNTIGCEEYEEIESRKVHLRRCIICHPIRGYDSSINNNGTKNLKKIYHPIKRRC